MKRFLLIIPIALFAIFHYWVFNPDDQSYGLIHFGLKGLFVFLFLVVLVTSYFALIVPLSSRQIRVEIFLFGIFSLSIFTIIYTLTVRGHTSGTSWVIGENREFTDLSCITFNENGNFTISLYSVDFGANYSGEYIKRGDTIFLERTVIDKTHNIIDSIYIIKDSILRPIGDETKSISFLIKSK